MKYKLYSNKYMNIMHLFYLKIDATLYFNYTIFQRKIKYFLLSYIYLTDIFTMTDFVGQDFTFNHRKTVNRVVKISLKLTNYNIKMLICDNVPLLSLSKIVNPELSLLCVMVASSRFVCPVLFSFSRLVD